MLEQHGNAADWKINEKILGLDQLTWRKRIVARSLFLDDNIKNRRTFQWKQSEHTIEEYANVSR